MQACNILLLAFFLGVVSALPTLQGHGRCAGPPCHSHSDCRAEHTKNGAACNVCAGWGPVLLCMREDDVAALCPKDGEGHCRHTSDRVLIEGFANQTTPPAGSKCHQHVAADNNPNNFPDPTMKGHTYHFWYTKNNTNHRISDIYEGPCPESFNNLHHNLTFEHSARLAPAVKVSPLRAE